MTRLRLVGILLPVAGILLSTGCSQNTERVGTSEQRAAPDAGKSAGTQEQAAPAGGDVASGLAWDAPSGWVKEQPASSMRAAQYRIPSGSPGVKDGELAVFFFGVGQGGGTQANLERWATQFQQDDGSDPMKNAKIDTFTTPGGLKVTTISLEGHYLSGGMGGPSYDEPGWRLLGAVVEGQGGPWFFKTVGPDEVVNRHHDEMIALLKSARTTG